MKTVTASEAAGQSSRPGAISLNIKDKSILYAAYMGYVRGGGIFIPTARPYKLGDEIFMLISLTDDPAKLPVAGRVVWVTPSGCHGNRVQGIGVQFKEDESGVQARRRIEGLLGGQLQSGRPTHTL
ncbi:MAG: PilZ domain-containing protein [Burkholderiales bacterium]|nr:PilZ domain-containing protein [Burkholderiales bacterium]